MRLFWVTRRLLQFRHDLAKLWRAFLNPKTPFWIKAAMVGVVVYLVSPIDLIPDFLLLFGLIDDLVLVPLLLSWIARYVPEDEPVGGDDGTRTVDGTSRRL